MERNSNETPTNHTPGQGGATGSGAAPLSGSGFGASAGSGSAGSSASGSSTGSSSGGSSRDASHSGLADRAKNVASGARDAVGSAREKLGGAKDALADKLEAGSDLIRQRSQGGSMAGAGEGSMAMEGDGRMAALGSSVATGMKGTADWLRDADIESMKATVEQQVKEHPGRTLLVALGLGYLLGKAFRR